MITTTPFLVLPRCVQELAVLRPTPKRKKARVPSLELVYEETVRGLGWGKI